jgi:hypothetical protein
MNLAPGPELTTYRVFLSSANTRRLVALRDQVEYLIRDIVSDQLNWANEAFRFETVRWETAGAQRVDGATIERFVEQAIQCQLTIVLLVDDMRPGTRREVQAVLNHEPEKIEVAILRFTRKTERNADQDELGTYLRWIRSRYKLLVRTVNRSDREQEWAEIVRTAVAALIAAYRAQWLARRERFDETR